MLYESKSAGIDASDIIPFQIEAIPTNAFGMSGTLSTGSASNRG